MAPGLIKVTKRSLKTSFLQMMPLFRDDDEDDDDFISKSAVQSRRPLRRRDKAGAEASAPGGTKRTFVLSFQWGDRSPPDLPEHQARRVDTGLCGHGGTGDATAEMCALRCGQWIHPVERSLQDILFSQLKPEG